MTTTLSTPASLWDWAERSPASIGANNLSASDIRDLKAATARVHALVSDGRWHTATEIIEASGVREGLRRCRELRKIGTVEGRPFKGREYEYRFIPNA